MLTFKQLRENAQAVKPAWVASIPELVFGLEHNKPQFGRIYIPLVGKGKRTLLSNYTKAVHATSFKGAEQVLNLQNREKTQISVATEFNRYFNGVHHTGEIFLLLEGDVYVRYYMDQFSVPDKSGVRWIDMSRVAENSTKMKRILLHFKKVIEEKFYNKFIEELEEITKNEHILELILQFKNEPDEIQMRYYRYAIFREVILKNLSGAEKRLVGRYIETYYKIAEQLLLRYEDEIINAVRQHEENPVNDEYDEAVMGNFKVVRGLVQPGVFRGYDREEIRTNLHRSGFFKLRALFDQQDIPLHEWSHLVLDPDAPEEEMLFNVGQRIQEEYEEALYDMMNEIG